jgi:hypothetical protein
MMFPLSLKNKKYLLPVFLLAIVALAFVVILYFYFLSIGPGLPPSEGMPEWYFPDSVHTNNTYLAYFPDISEYAASGVHSSHIMMCVWYFDDRETFLEASGGLSEYLAESGTVGVTELDIADELNKTIEARESKKYWKPTFGPKTFNATVYENGTTSGYFLVYSKPFLESRDDYFIVYYGTKNNGSLPEQEQQLEELIADSYYNSEGEVTGLGMASGNS